MLVIFVFCLQFTMMIRSNLYFVVSYLFLLSIYIQYCLYDFSNRKILMRSWMIKFNNVELIFLLLLQQYQTCWLIYMYKCLCPGMMAVHSSLERGNLEYSATCINVCFWNTHEAVRGCYWFNFSTCCTSIIFYSFIDS